MHASFFKAVSNFNLLQLMRDIIRVVRDLLAVANNFLHLKMISELINGINEGLGDTQKNPTPNIV